MTKEAATQTVRGCRFPFEDGLRHKINVFIKQNRGYARLLIKFLTMKKIFLILSTFISITSKASSVDSVIVSSKQDYTVSVYNNYIFSESILLKKVDTELSTFIVKLTNLSTGSSKFYTYINFIDIIDFPNGLYLIEIADERKYLMSRRLVIQH